MRRTSAFAALAVALVFAGATPALGATKSHGYGAPLSSWVAAHPIDTADCPIGTCYGPLVASRPTTPEFSFLTVIGHRVVGYDEALPRGTTALEAELLVAEQFPPDVSVPRSASVVDADRYGHSCAVFDLYSATLAKLFGPKGPAQQGDAIGVELATTGRSGLAAYNPDSVDLAIVAPVYLDTSTNC